MDQIGDKSHVKRFRVGSRIDNDMHSVDSNTDVLVSPTTQFREGLNVDSNQSLDNNEMRLSAIYGNLNYGTHFNLNPSSFGHKYTSSQNNYINADTSLNYMESTPFSDNKPPIPFTVNIPVNYNLRDVDFENSDLMHNNNITDNKCFSIPQLRPKNSSILNIKNDNISGNRYASTNEPNTNDSFRARICSYCSKSFKYPSDLRKHLLIHDGVREYKCDKCTKSFRREHQLIVHKRIHTGEKPFTCQYCGATFRHDSTYAMHIRTKHDNIKPFFCETCKKAFGRLSHLRKHQKLVCNISKSPHSPDKINDDKYHHNSSPSIISSCNIMDPNNQKSHSLSPAINSNQDNSKSLIIIRCQYCLRDFRKTQELRHHLNTAGNCNLFYLLDLKRKENKLSNVKHGKNSNTCPITTTNVQLISGRNDPTVGNIIRNRDDNVNYMDCIPYIESVDVTAVNRSRNLSNNENMLLLNQVMQGERVPILFTPVTKIEDSPRTLTLGSCNQLHQQQQPQPQQQLPFNNQQIIAQIPCNHQPSNTSCVVPKNESHCFTDITDCYNYITPSNNLFDNLIPNNLFFDNQIFDIFRDIDIQPINNVNKNNMDRPSNGGRKYPEN